MHIFIAIGQTHLNNFETLLRNGIVLKEERVLVVDNTIVYNESMWTTVIKSDISFNNSATTKVEQLRSIAKKAKAYAKIIKNLEQYQNGTPTVYLAYIEDILSNYMFFSFSKNIKVVIVEDGTLNYYNHTLKNVSTFKFFLKQKIARFYGISFKKYEGHSSGADYDHVVKQYLGLPEFAFSSKNAAQLPLKKEQLDPIDTESLFIIGQEVYSNVVGDQEFMHALTGQFEGLKKQPFYNSISTIYYKPHRNGFRLTLKKLQAFFPSKKVVLIETSLTAERYYFENLQSRYVASFNSSTLLNIYRALDKNQNDQLRYFVYPITVDELIPIFKKMNFQFLKEV